MAGYPERSARFLCSRRSITSSCTDPLPGRALLEDAADAAAALVGAGAPLSEISRRLYRSKPDAQLRLFGRVLDRLETADEGRLIWSTLLEADLAATGSGPAHSEGLIDLLSQSERAEVAILFKEQGAATRISVRTKPGGVDARRVWKGLNSVWRWRYITWFWLVFHIHTG